jgi:hypothetical protein
MNNLRLDRIGIRCSSPLMGFSLRHRGCDFFWRPKATITTQQKGKSYGGKA